MKYLIEVNQILINGKGKNYYYLVNEKGRTVDLKTLKPYRGKELKRFGTFDKVSLEHYLEIINNSN